MMKKVIIIFAVLLITSLVLLYETSAQRQGTDKGRGGWSPGSPYARLYNPQTLETISGVVESVGNFTPTKGMSHGVHAFLKTDKESISVHLGPSWFIDNQDPKIEPGDKVEITGSRIMFEGKTAIIAASVTKDGETLTLRDPSGVPVWSGWRRK